MKPRLLDLFAGAGGCSVGYDRAGFEVTGVDIEPHSDYPFELIVGDAMKVLADQAFLDQFDAVHASPPCPFYSTATIASARGNHPDLVPPTFEALRTWGGVWVVENVPGAPMPGAVVLCGGAMGLPRIRRHRPVRILGRPHVARVRLHRTGSRRRLRRQARMGTQRPPPRRHLAWQARTHPRRSVRRHGHRLDEQARGRLGRHPAELHRVHRRPTHRPPCEGRRMTERLSVNINDECAEALRRIESARGITTTEAIRRAISLLDYFEKDSEWSCPRCEWVHTWRSAPTGASVRDLGRAIREHYEAAHPDAEVGR